MSIKQTLADAVKAAMKAKEKEKLQVLRGLSAAIKQYEVDNQADADDAQVLQILDKQIKQRKDAEKQFRDGGRDDLADIEAFEITVIQPFLPEPLSDAEIDTLIDNAIADNNDTSPAAMGKIMATLKPQLQGRADMGKVSGLVKQKLSK